MLPPYPFARKDIPYIAPTAEIARQRQQRNGPLNYLQLQLNDKTHPDLAEHVIKSAPIMSTAGYLEMVSVALTPRLRVCRADDVLLLQALEFGAKKLYNVELVSILSLSAKRPTPVEIKLESTRWSVRSSSAVDYTKTWPPQVSSVYSISARVVLSD